MDIELHCEVPSVAACACGVYTYGSTTAKASMESPSTGLLKARGVVLSFRELDLGD